MEIGKRLRETRKRRKLTIDEIAKASGLSRPYISQVETGKASPSIPSLEKLARALDIPVASLFDDATDEFTCEMFPKDEQQVLVFGSPDGPASERKSIHFMSAARRDLEFCMLELAPGYVAGEPDHRHAGEEVFFVRRGTLQVIHGDRSFRLSEGDSIHVNATIIHRIINIGSEIAEVLVARTPAGFAETRIAKSELKIHVDDVSGTRGDAVGQLNASEPD